MLDVETNNALAAEIMGVRYLQKPQVQETVPKENKKEEDYPAFPDFDW